MGTTAQRLRPVLQTLVFPLRTEYIATLYAVGTIPSADRLLLDIEQFCLDINENVGDWRTAQRWFFRRVSTDPVIRTLMVWDTLRYSEGERSLVYSALGGPATGFKSPRRVVHWNTVVSCHNFHNAWMMRDGADTLVVHNRIGHHSRAPLLYAKFVECIVAFFIDLPCPPRTVIFAIHFLLSDSTTKEEHDGLAELKKVSPSTPDGMTLRMRVKQYAASEEDDYWRTRDKISLFHDAPHSVTKMTVSTQIPFFAGLFPQTLRIDGNQKKYCSFHDCFLSNCYYQGA